MPSHDLFLQFDIIQTTAVQDVSPTSEPTQSSGYREKKPINYAYISLLSLLLIPCAVIGAVYYYRQKNRNAETVREAQRVRIEEAALSATISTQPSNDFVFDNEIILMDKSVFDNNYPPARNSTQVYKNIV